MRNTAEHRGTLRNTAEQQN
uniref:Uncharacterized protein n=1 Tax=Anguilla anguilla TaxID=7936 RepID=A0A0E9SEZ7_ANGAN